MNTPHQPKAGLIQQAHALYCQLTSQKLALRFDRERMWYELLRQGYDLDHLRQVITYLQKEIRNGRRNIGALKLSNLLQPDRFEEDYNISRAKLYASPKKDHSTPATQKLDPQEQERRRQSNLQALRQLRQELNLPPKAPD